MNSGTAETAAPETGGTLLAAASLRLPQGSHGGPARTGALAPRSDWREFRWAD